MGGNGGGGCVARHNVRTSIRQSTVSPIDLCRLNALTRGPTGFFGISCIHQPKAIIPSTRPAMSQCSAIAVVVYRSAESEFCIDGETGERVTTGRRLEEAAVGIADDHRADVVAIEEIVDSRELSKRPRARRLFESDANVGDRVVRRRSDVPVVDVELAGVLALERGRASVPFGPPP